MTQSHTGRFAVALTGLAALAPLSHGQTKLIEEGDPIPGLPMLVCTRIDDVAVNNSGDWALRLDTDADSSMDEVVIKNDALVFQQGTNFGLGTLAPLGTYNFLDAAILTDDGHDVYLVDVALNSGGTADVVFRDGVVLLQQDITPITAPGLPAGSVWETISEVWANASNQLLVGGRTDNGKDCIIKITLDAAGAILSEEIIVIEGVTLPGHPTPIQGLSLSRYRNAINNAGSVLWFVDDDHTVAGGSTANDSWIYRDSMPLIREGDPMNSHPGSVWGTQSSAEVYLNNNGDYAYKGARDGAFNLDVITINDSTIIAEEGQTVTQVPGNFILDGIGSTSGAFLSDNDDVVWFGEWNDTNSDLDSGIFFNDEILFQEGVSETVNGDVIDTIANTDKAFAVSDNGTYLIVEFFSITTADPTFNGVYLYDINPNIGDAYCMTNPNSTGVSGALTGSGSVEVADNSFSLTASDLPQNAFAFIIVSQTQGFAANPGGSSGNICVAGQVGRVVGGSILNTGASGSIAVTADLTAIPQPNGPVAVMAGETWNFQGWHRDSAGGMATSNFTNGLEVTFQ